MSEMRAETSTGGSGSSGFRLVRFAREIFPFLQSTQWVSLSGPNERERVAGAYDIVFAHGLLDQIRRHAGRVPDSDTVGLFFGQGCECPWTRRLWIRVDTALGPELPRKSGWRRRAPETVDQRPIEERLQSLLARPDRPRGHIVGWYHTRAEGAPRLSSAETEILAARFDEPWQFCVAIPTDTQHPVLGVFGRDEGGEVRPNLLRPFYELKQNGSQLRHRPVAPWNYRVVERAERSGSAAVLSDSSPRRAWCSESGSVSP